MNFDDFTETTKVSEVLQYLKSKGIDVPQRSLYGHSRQGKLRQTARGKFTRETVEEYCKVWLKVDMDGDEQDDTQALMDRKLKGEVKKIESQAARAEFEFEVLKKDYVSRDEFELAIVARAVAFMAHLNHTIQMGVPDWIDAVNGDQSRASDLVAIISEAIEQRMSDFAADVEFEVILEPNE